MDTPDQSGAAAEIVPGNVSGGTNTSHTIVVAALARLLDSTPPDAVPADYERAAVEANVLGKDTHGARWRTFRYLRELYLLRPDSVLFRALRDLWPIEAPAQPLLAGLCALARDSVFRASAAAISRTSSGEVVRAADLAAAVEEAFPGNYGAETLAKIGRNTFSSWEQTGHLTPDGVGTKFRARAGCGPADVAYALLLGHLEGVRGKALFETRWTAVLDRSEPQLLEMAATASRLGMLELRSAAGVVEVGFRELLRPFDSGPGGEVGQLPR